MDDQGRVEEAVIAVKKLISNHKTVAIITGATSSRTMAMAPVAQTQGIPLLPTAATHPRVTQHGDYIFRVSFIDPFQGLCMAKFAKNSLSLNKVAIMSDLKNDYSLGLAEAFKKSFLKDGGQIIETQYYSSGDIDFKAQLTSLKERKAEAIFVSGYYGDVALIARQAVDLGISMASVGNSPLTRVEMPFVLLLS